MVKLAQLSVFFATALGAIGDVYTVVDVYDASTILDKVTFFTGTDPTHGLVDYVTETVAISTGLVYDADNVTYFRVDNTTELWGTNRPSVRWTSDAAYNDGLFIFDIAHMPFGCGTWPALWLLGSGQTWPYAGEIDIIEGVNTQAKNSQTLHTQPGCNYTAAELTQTGTLTFGDCNSANDANSNEGCGVTNPSNLSYGASFNSIRGGVYATEWSNAGINIWFFPRGSIPSDITSDSPDPSGWGVPSSNWPFGTTCEASFFSDMQIVLDTTFCGDWAGNVYGNGDSCLGGTGQAACDWFVQHSPSEFSEAYWAINSLKVYGSSNSTTTPATATARATTTTSVAATATSTAYTFPSGQYWGNDCTYTGGDITNLQTTGALCGSACESFSGCEYFVWTELNGGTCWLKDYSTSGPIAADTGVCGYLNPASPNYGFSDATTLQWANGCAWTGLLVSNSTSHPDGSVCGGECLSLTECTHFQFNVTASTCDFFDSSAAGPVYQPNGMCGFTTPNSPIATATTANTIAATTTSSSTAATSTGYTFSSGQYWGTYCTYTGGDITNLQTTGALCGPACEAFAGCDYFVWTDLNGGTCWLKDYSTTGPIVANTGVCGYLNPASPNYGFSDATTLQWANDCAWTGSLVSNSTSHPDGSLCGGECLSLTECTHFQFNVTASTCDFFDSSAVGPVYQANGMCGFTTPNPAVV
ncbi:hypothetical protein HK100_005970 [Physocladia obscura]|uniref:GH16 domain-containing protein n=1 Tax=Physocladia obscura TaxID=109957 RepID=A0AAD5ST21_9FUNG|nr:hypothetical protein HK100_005970 [Physocladia obscura]